MPVLVAAVVAASYLHTLPYPFLFDDLSSIRDNATLAPPLDLPSIWWFRPSRFVVYLSFALNGLVTGMTPAGLRAVNLLIHLVAACLVGWIGRELAGRLEGQARSAARLAPERVELASALIFAAHPLATQAVTYLVQRTTSLAALWQLAAVALYLRARGGGSRWIWVLSWGCGLLAALTKESALALPLLVLLLEWRLAAAGPQPAARRSPARLVPYFLVVPVVAALSRLPSTYDWQTPREPHAPTEYVLTQLTVVPRYLRLALWPAGQNLDPDVPIRHSLDGGALVGLAVIVMVVGLGLLVRRSRPLAALGIAWFLTALLPESSFLPISDVMSEHRTYLPMAGLAWAGAEWLTALRVQRRRSALAAAVLVVSLTLATVARNRVWRDGVSLWGDVVGKSPHGARGHNNYGMFLEEAGRWPEAETAFRRAIAADSAYVLARLNLAALERRQGRLPEALSLLREAHRLAPSNWAVLNNLGNALLAAGDTAAAVHAYRQAISLAPGRREPADNLARIPSSARPRPPAGRLESPASPRP